MKTIEISDDAFLIINHYAKTRANGDIATYVDRLVGATKERRNYEELPQDVETQFLKAYHPEKLNNPEVVCAILDVIRKLAPRRFNTVAGFRFPDRNRVVLSRNLDELGEPRLVHRIGDSDLHVFTGFDSEQLKDMFHELLLNIGYSPSAAKAFERYIRKTGTTENLALKYI